MRIRFGKEVVVFEEVLVAMYNIDKFGHTFILPFEIFDLETFENI